ncbi:hypothetical protein GDO86_015604 [Hymenochirus boettgeri]|uniref:Uncharacterized protein n=1 Tax=Hymenochirus boettgeri TaxID=247094 RepID=A0A8T2JYX4_9PIPI|nr:hypothetical protein GDO86_015604 [Hymenochirus boettgeri]
MVSQILFLSNILTNIVFYIGKLFVFSFHLFHPLRYTTSCHVLFLISSPHCLPVPPSPPTLLPSFHLSYFLPLSVLPFISFSTPYLL